MTDRCKAEFLEASFEPGSRGRVLRNRLGIKLVRDMEREESESLLAATQSMIDETQTDQRFTAHDVCMMHRRWLGGIYAWAGDYRQLNVSKGGFLFAVPRLMQEFERGPLRQYTPCKPGTIDDQAAALAVVHAELILIHPFRDGNGRCARLLATLMGLQAGLPALDYGDIRGAKKRAYFAAVHAALDRDYAPMTEVFREIILRTMRSAATSFSD
jgi:cell filamentation protein